MKVITLHKVCKMCQKPKRSPHPLRFTGIVNIPPIQDKRLPLNSIICRSANIKLKMANSNESFSQDSDWRLKRHLSLLPHAWGQFLCSDVCWRNHRWPWSIKPRKPKIKAKIIKKAAVGDWRRGNYLSIVIFVLKDDQDTLILL